MLEESVKGHVQSKEYMINIPLKPIIDALVFFRIHLHREFTRAAGRRTTMRMPCVFM